MKQKTARERLTDLACELDGILKMEEGPKPEDVDAEVVHLAARLLRLTIAPSVGLEKAPAPPGPQMIGPEKVVEAEFPAELQELLEFSVHEDSVRIRPRKFLGSERFYEVLQVVKRLGGEYVSQGKQSYFWVPAPRGK